MKQMTTGVSVPMSTVTKLDQNIAQRVFFPAGAGGKF